MILIILMLGLFAFMTYDIVMNEPVYPVESF